MHMRSTQQFLDRMDIWQDSELPKDPWGLIMY